PFDGDEPRIVEALELILEVEHVGRASSHSGTEVLPGATEHHDRSTGHVLAAVVTDSLHHRDAAGVADRESLTSTAVGKERTAGRTVQARVSDDRVVPGLEFVIL